MRITPLTPAFGAEVHEIDLANELGDVELVDRIRAASPASCTDPPGLRPASRHWPAYPQTRRGERVSICAETAPAG